MASPPSLPSLTQQHHVTRVPEIMSVSAKQLRHMGSKKKGQESWVREQCVESHSAHPLSPPTPALKTLRNLLANNHDADKMPGVPSSKTEDWVSSLKSVSLIMQIDRISQSVNKIV